MLLKACKELCIWIIRIIATLNITINQGLAGARRILPIIDLKEKISEDNSLEKIDLNKGNIEQVGTPDEIYKDPDNIFVAQFIGTPKMNILPLKNENIISDNKINFLGNEITMKKLSLIKVNILLE